MEWFAHGGRAHVEAAGGLLGVIWGGMRRSAVEEDGGVSIFPSYP